MLRVVCRPACTTAHPFSGAAHVTPRACCTVHSKRQGPLVQLAAMKPRLLGRKEDEMKPTHVRLGILLNDAGHVLVEVGAVGALVSGLVGARARAL